MSNAGAVVAAIRLRKERGIVSALRERAALSDRTAIALETKRGLERSAMRGLLKHGAVKETASGSFYLDEAAYDEMRAKRRFRGVMVAAGIVIALAVVAVVTAMNM